MLKGRLGIAAAVVVLGLTFGVYALVSGDGSKKADSASRARVTSAFYAVRTVMDLDAQAAKAHAAHYANLASSIFDRLEKYQTTVAGELAQNAATLGEGWSPDFMAVLDRSNIIIWSQLNSTVTKAGTPTDYATNLRVSEPYVDSVKRGEAPVAFGKLKLNGVLNAPLTTVAVPLLGSKKRVLMVVLLAWKGRSDAEELKSKAIAFRDRVNIVPIIKDLMPLKQNIEALFTQRLPEELKSKQGIKGAFVGLLDMRGVLMMRSDWSTNKLFVGQQLAPQSKALYEARAQLQATTEVWPKSKILESSAPSAKSGAAAQGPEILRVGFGPVLNQENKLVGVVIVAWFCNVQQNHMGELSGAEVAFLSGNQLSTTSLKRVSGKLLSSVPQTNFGPLQWDKPKIKSLMIGEETYLAAAAKFPRSGNQDSYSFVVLASIEKAKQPFGFGMMMIIIFGAIVALGFIVVGLLIRRYFILPIDELEKGVADIVAGNMEHTFGVPSAETEGLAYSLNVLMAQLLGRPEPGEEDEEQGEGGSGGPRMLFSLGPLPDRAYRPGDSQLIPRLDEDRPTYFKRIFQEYLDAMKGLGEDTTGMNVEALQKKLEVNERMICARLKCGEVRFSVVPGEEGVVLQPYPIA
ncbi:MAG: MXAN_5187 C-terminal domain-containing protein [bacterium]